MSYPPLLAWVMDALRKGWTPELIEGRLKVEWPDDPRMRISHECLHRWIHAKPQRALDLRRYLPRGKRHRTRSKGRRERGPRIPMRVPIAKRPKRVDPRREFGHYESDTAVGSAPSRRCIDTQVGRKSSRLSARFIPDKGVPATARAEYYIHKDIPAPARIDRTWDNGTESSCHLLVDEALGMLTYYADPYSSYQRGTNETATGASAATCPREPASTTSRTRTCRPSSGRSTAPHEGPGLGNAQRGLVPRARQGNVEDKPPKDERCTYKFNPGIRLFFTRARITSSKPPK